MSGLPERSSEIEASFPKLSQGYYKITSKKSKLYNCIAWAGGDDQHWWEATSSAFNVGPYVRMRDRTYFWPVGILQDGSLLAHVQLYSLYGYEVCADGVQEPGFEKLALFIKNGSISHAARQSENGVWTSKLGPEEDIEHKTPELLVGRTYGIIAQFLRRPLKRE